MLAVSSRDLRILFSIELSFLQDRWAEHRKQGGGETNACPALPSTWTPSVMWLFVIAQLLNTVRQTLG